MTRKELIDQVTRALTVSCALPYSPPDAEIDRLIDVEMRWLFREYRTLWQDKINPGPRDRGRDSSTPSFSNPTQSDGLFLR